MKDATYLTTYQRVRPDLLALFGQATAVASIDPNCSNPKEMLQAAKETGQLMKSNVLRAIKLLQDIDEEEQKGS